MFRYFKFDQLHTNYRKETLGGLTTFFAMAYIIIVNPAILNAGGIPKEAGTTATILACVIGTLIMAFYARRPFAIAPYMGENAFVAYTVCLGMGYSWEKALGAVFISGIIFIIITALKVRSWISTAIPDSLKKGFAASIGFFIMFIGFNESGISVLGVEGAPVHIGNLTTTGPLLAIFCVILTLILMVRKIPGALLIGMLFTTILAYLTGYTSIPSQIISAPPSLSPLFMKLDIVGALRIDFIPIILVLFIMAFIDTMGTLIGLSSRAGFLDANNNLPEIEKPMMADAVATTAAGLMGTTTSGAFLESAAGIEAGARSGFASLITALMFVLCLFFTPLLVTVPSVAYGAALVCVGFLMISPIKDLPFDDYTELFPAVTSIAVMAFTYNIGFGFAAGFLMYPIFKIATGRISELKPGIWVMFVIAILLFVIYPYQ